MLQQVLVVGGGSAGWLVAGLLAAEHGPTGSGRLGVTLIESPDTPAIGVGEGTWPSMRETLHRIGLREIDLIRECDAAFKQGSRFDGWLSGSAGEHYHHPFTLPQGHGEADLVGGWLHEAPGLPFAEAFCAQPAVCAASLAPKQVGTPAYAGVLNYGYHFDAVKLGRLLRRHAIEALGVRHVVDEVTQIRSHENGDIAALHTRHHGEITADLFIDCSGLASLLLGQHFGVPLRSEREVLFNDSALAVQVPYAAPDAPIASTTIATAHAEGWTWDIGLPTRRGVGLVFSSAHTTPEQAEQRLRAHLGEAAAGVSPRLIRFSPGYRERFWQRNCVAVGLSAGFIEPLEASALALVELSAAMIRDEMPADRAAMDIVARRFNEAFSYRWERIIDFLKLHYLLSRREDSDYWREHRRPATQPERLRELMQLWQHRAPGAADLFRNQEVFPAASYQYVLCGMGFRPTAWPLSAPRLAAAQACARDAGTLSRRLLGALPRHRDLLHHLHHHGQLAA